MINVENIIRKGNFYIKNNIDKKELEKRLMFNQEIDNDANLQTILSCFYFIIKNPQKSIKEDLIHLYNLRKDFFIEMVFEKISIILHNSRLENKDLEDYLSQEIYPYYRGKFDRRLSREISFLPLELRLYIYTNMYFLEENENVRWHIIDRLCVTLSKMGYINEAQLTCSINWLNDLEDNKSSSLQEFKGSIDFIKDSRKNRHLTLKTNEFTPDKLIGELQNSLSRFIDLNLIMDKNSAKIMVGCLALYYNKIPGILNYKDKIIAFIETEDVGKLDELAELKRKYEVQYQVYEVNEGDKKKINRVKDSYLKNLLSVKNEENLKKYVDYKMKGE